MRCFLVVSALSLSLVSPAAIPALGQHAAAAGYRGGGFAGHAMGGGRPIGGGGYRGGLTPSANHGIPGGSHLPWDGVVNPPFGINNFGPSRTGTYSGGMGSGHGYVGMHGYGGGRGPYRSGREHHGYGRDFSTFLNGAYLVPGWIGPGMWGYPDLVDDAENADSAPDQYASYPSGPPQQEEGYPGAQEGYGGSPEPWQPPMQAPRGAYRPQANQPQTNQPQLTAEPTANRPSLTLIFWDLRPNQEVHDYLVTPKTLYVFDGGRRREIPLVDVDVVATAQANRENGVEFGVPIAGK